jgi:rRNA maturation protein Nop10
MFEFYKLLKVGGQKLEQDNAKELSYESGMVGPGLTTTTISNKRQKTASDGCPHCGLLTHHRITSRLCWKHPCTYNDGNNENDEMKKRCPQCGLNTHSRRTSKLCAMNPRNVQNCEQGGEWSFFWETATCLVLSNIIWRAGQPSTDFMWTSTGNGIVGAITLFNNKILLGNIMHYTNKTSFGIFRSIFSQDIAYIANSKLAIESRGVSLLNSSSLWLAPKMDRWVSSKYKSSYRQNRVHESTKK